MKRTANDRNSLYKPDRTAGTKGNINVRVDADAVCSKEDLE